MNHITAMRSPKPAISARANQRPWTSVVLLGSMMALVFISVCGLAFSDYYLCVECLFLAFIPYIVWSSIQRAGTLDVFSPDLGFPLIYVIYLFFGSINLPFKTEFGFVLPWIIWVYYILGLAAYLAGIRFLHIIEDPAARRFVPKIFWDQQRFLTASCFLLVVGLGARTITMAKSGIPIFHSDDVDSRLAGAGGIIGVLSLSAEAGFECLLLYLLTKKADKTTRILIYIGMALVVLDGLATTNRTGLLRFALAGAVIYHYIKKRFTFGKILITAIVAIVVTSALGTYRDVSVWGQAHVNSLEQKGLTDQTYWLFSGYQAIRLPTETFYMTIQQIPAFSPYTYGATSLASLAEVLPGHRPGPSEIVKKTLHLRFVGFGAAATILAPLWFDGGVTGIILGMFLIGVISRALYQQMLHSRNYLWVLIYSWYVQNAFKAVKDDILPELGFTFVLFLFVVVSICSSDNA